MPDEFKEDKALLHSNIAITLMKMQRFEEAEPECSAALELNPGLTKAQANRAECRFQTKQFQKSVDGGLNRLGGSEGEGQPVLERAAVGRGSATGQTGLRTEEGRGPQGTQNARQLDPG